MAPSDVADRRLNRIGAFVRGLGHDVAGVVDHIGIVAGAADQGVGARSAIERVVAGAAGQHVGAGVAGQGVVERRAGQVLEARQRIGAGATVFCAVVSARLTVTPAAACSYDTVSVPAPPASTLLPPSPSSVSS